MPPVSRCPPAYPANVMNVGTIRRASWAAAALPAAIGRRAAVGEYRRVEMAAGHAMTEPRRLDRLIRMKELLTIVPLARSTIYERMARNEFPRPRDAGGGVVGWRESDIRAWLDSLPETVHAA